MAKVTNTTNLSLYVGKVEIKPHSTAEVPDDELATAKKNKVVASWFASEKLALGDTAATKEATAKQKGKLSTAGTPPGAIRPKEDKTGVSLGGRRKPAPPPKPTTTGKSVMSTFFGQSKERHGGKQHKE
jgi:hypothetical protein